MEGTLKHLEKLMIVVFLGLGHLVYGSPGQSKHYLLIEDMEIQIETTQALNDMYNFKFRKAFRQFVWLKQEFPEHPLPYLLMGMNEWWQIMPNFNDKSHDKRFMAYMDTTIQKAEKLYEIDSSKVEAAFFLSAAYGFKARLYSERGRWFKAATTTNQSLQYLEDCRGKDELSPELMFGDGIYNYFSNWIPDHYPALKPFMIFFDRGDKYLGLKQLRQVAHNAFYTRTEAQYWLMRILYTEENDIQGALHESEYLHETYPDNAYFHRYYARLLYGTGRLVKARLVAEDLLAKVDSGYVGYEATSGRYACFYLGQIAERNLDDQKAMFYYSRAVDFSEKSGETKAGYYLYSLLGMAKIEKEKGNTKAAKSYLKKVRKNSDRKNLANKRAKEMLIELRKKDGN